MKVPNDKRPEFKTPIFPKELKDGTYKDFVINAELKVEAEYLYKNTLEIKRALQRLTEDKVPIESCNNECLLLDNGNSHNIHGFLQAVFYAHQYHIPLQISPCDIWTMIM